jgi:hypothetical protein
MFLDQAIRRSTREAAALASARRAKPARPAGKGRSRKAA